MTPQNLLSTVKQVQTMVSERLLNSPTYGVFIHARDQLVKIESIVSAGLIPTEIQKNEIDIALMAVKELETTDPELADILCMVDYQFKNLT